MMKLNNVPKIHGSLQFQLLAQMGGICVINKKKINLTSYKFGISNPTLSAFKQVHCGHNVMNEKEGTKKNHTMVYFIRASVQRSGVAQVQGLEGTHKLIHMDKKAKTNKAKESPNSHKAHGTGLAVSHHQQATSLSDRIKRHHIKCAH